LFLIVGLRIFKKLEVNLTAEDLKVRKINIKHSSEFMDDYFSDSHYNLTIIKKSLMIISI